MRTRCMHAPALFLLSLAALIAVVPRQSSRPSRSGEDAFDILCSDLYAAAVPVLRSADHGPRQAGTGGGSKSPDRGPGQAGAGGGMSPMELMVKIHDANAVGLAVSNTGQIGIDIFHNNGQGIWPSWTGNNYIFGSGLWIGGLADVDGDGIEDTVVVYGYNTLDGASEHREGRVGQDTSDPLARVFSSTDPADLAEWPPEFRDQGGTPIVHSAQDFVTIYNDISGEPAFATGRAGLEVKQRSMAFVGGLNFNTILVFFEVTNRSDSLPDGPFTLREAYAAFVSDTDIGTEFADDRTSVLDSIEVYRNGKAALHTGFAWDENFDENGWEGKVGFVGTLFLQPPGNPSDGIDNDGDGLVDESPFDGTDDDGDGTADDIPDEVDAVSEFHYTAFASPSIGPPPVDPQTDAAAYRMMRCLTEGDCGETTESSDWRYMISYGSFDLSPGESQIVGVAIVFAEPVGDPTHLDVYGDPPRPDPADSVLAEFVATIMSGMRLYESGFQDEEAPFMIFGTTDLEDTNDPRGPYEVFTNIVDSIPLARTTLHYRAGSVPFEEVGLRSEFGNVFTAEIPGHSFWSTVSYYIQAVDSAYQVLRDPWNAPQEVYDFRVLDSPRFARIECGECSSTQAVAPADYDLDGLSDILVLSYNPPVLLRNLGGFAFDDVTEEAGIVAPAQARGAAWGDYDEDGDPDLFIAVYGAGNTHFLYRNNGDGSLQEVSTEAGVSDSLVTNAGIWGDVNGDGLLDLLTVQYGTDRLYLNQGDGTFTEAGGEWGIGETLNDKAATFFDMEGDRDLDLVLTGGGGTFLYENIDGEGFIDITASSGIPMDAEWTGISIGDFDADGDPDLLMSASVVNVYENRVSPGYFLDVTEELGLAGLSASDASWADVNNDGLLDVVTSRPSLFVRNPEGLFTDVTDFTGLSAGSGTANAILSFDADGDGFLDLAHGDIWQNEGFPAGITRHWLGLALQGTASSRQAVGTRARLFAGNLAQSRWASGGDGKSQEHGILSFGLGDMAAADSLVLDWPSGATQRLTALAADQIHGVVEDSTLGVGGGERAGGLPRFWALSQNYPNPFNPQTAISFDIPGGEQSQPVRVRLAIFDVRGRLVKVLVEKDLPAGCHTVTWDGREANGALAPSGVYFYRLKAGKFTETRKMLLMK